MRPLSELYIERRVTESPSAEAVHITQAEIGRELPLDYLDFLGEYNGGAPEVDTIQHAGGDWSVDHFYSITNDYLYEDGIFAVHRQWMSVIGLQCVPIAVDGGGNQFVLDFSDVPPSVGVVIHDESFRLVKLSRTFAQFIDALKRNMAYI